QMKRIQLLLAILLFALGAQAQAPGPAVKMKWKQIQTGNPGEVAIVGTDSVGHWVTPPFLNISDTSAMLAAYGSAINARVKYTDTAAMLSVYRTALQARVKFTDTAAMLSAYRTAIADMQANKADDDAV